MSQLSPLGLLPNSAGEMPAQANPVRASLGGGHRRQIQQLVGHSSDPLPARVEAAQKRTTLTPETHVPPFPPVVALPPSEPVEQRGMREVEQFKRRFEVAAAADPQDRANFMQYAVHAFLIARNDARNGIMSGRWDPEVLMRLDIYLLRAEAQFNALTRQPLFGGTVFRYENKGLVGFRNNLSWWSNQFVTLYPKAHGLFDRDDAELPFAPPLEALPDEPAVMNLLTALVALNNKMDKACCMGDCTGLVLCAIDLALLEKAFPQQCKGRLSNLAEHLNYEYGRKTKYRFSWAGEENLFGGTDRSNLGFKLDPLNERNQKNALPLAARSDYHYGRFYRFVEDQMNEIELSPPQHRVVNSVMQGTSLPKPLAGIVWEYAFDNQKRQLSYLVLMTILLKEINSWDTHRTYCNQLLQRACAYDPSLLGGAQPNPEKMNEIEFPHHPLINHFMKIPDRNKASLQSERIEDWDNDKKVKIEVDQFVRTTDQILKSEAPLEEQSRAIASKLEAILKSGHAFPPPSEALLRLCFLKISMKFPELRGGLLIDDEMRVFWGDDSKNVKGLQTMEAFFKMGATPDPEGLNSTSQEYVQLFPLLDELYRDDPILNDHLVNMVQVMNLENDLNDHRVHRLEAEVQKCARMIGLTVSQKDGVYSVEGEFAHIPSDAYKDAGRLLDAFAMSAEVWKEQPAGLTERQRTILSLQLEEARDKMQAIDRQTRLSERQIERYAEHPIHWLRLCEKIL